MHERKVIEKMLEKGFSIINQNKENYHIVKDNKDNKLMFITIPYSETVIVTVNEGIQMILEDLNCEKEVEK